MILNKQVKYSDRECGKNMKIKGVTSAQSDHAVQSLIVCIDMRSCVFVSKKVQCITYYKIINKNVF